MSENKYQNMVVYNARHMEKLSKVPDDTIGLHLNECKLRCLCSLKERAVRTVHKNKVKEKIQTL